MAHVVAHARAQITVTDLGGGKRRIEVRPRDRDLYVARDECVTTYPLPLIETILRVKGPGYLCDEIRRDEDPDYIQPHIEAGIFRHVNVARLADGRILDFGCGSAASTMVLCRLLPGARITGLDLEDELLAIARARAEHHGVADRVTFLRSPAGDRLPAGLGEFDAICLNAVYEHLLPAERRQVMPLLWEHLAPGGVLLLNQTPHRWFPVEFHTTGGLPLVNYAPAPLAAVLARRFSRRGLTDDSWPVLLRKGIRGGSVHEVLGHLSGDTVEPVLLAPRGEGVRDRIDLWYSLLGRARHARAKERTRRALKVIKALTGRQLVPSLNLAILKPDPRAARRRGS